MVSTSTSQSQDSQHMHITKYTVLVYVFFVSDSQLLQMCRAGMEVSCTTYQLLFCLSDNLIYLVFT